MDTRTLGAALILVAGALALVIVGVAAFRRQRHLTIYAGGFATGMVSFLLFLGQGVLTPWVTVLASNFLSVFFYLALAWGVRTWARRPRPWARRFTVYVVAWTPVLLATTFVWDSYQARAIIYSLLIILLTVEILGALLHSAQELPRALKVGSWLVALGVVFCYALRIGLLVDPAQVKESLMSNNPASVLIFAITLVFSILWAGVILIIDAVGLVAELSDKNRQLEILASTDPLTGLANRQHLDRQLAREIDRAHRYGEDLCLLLFDLDHFKAVNDTWGHKVGDEVLVRTARLLAAQIRGSDSSFRWGGEEFVVLAPHTNLAGGLALADKIRAAFAAQPYPTVGPVTASFGVAAWVPGLSAEHWFKRADQALYQAKEGGRNRVEAWNPDHPPLIVPQSLEWRPEWNSGHPLIDEEHRALFDQVRHLLVLCAREKDPRRLTLEFDHTLTLVTDHFTHEEEVLRQAAYPGLEDHLQTHRRLAAEARALGDRFQAGLAGPHECGDFLVNQVIVGHMIGQDIEFFAHTRGLRAD